MVFSLSQKNKLRGKHIARGIILVLFILIASFFIQIGPVHAQVPVTDPFAGIKSVSEIQEKYRALLEARSPKYRMMKDIQLRNADNAQFPYSPDNTPINLSDYPLEVDKGRYPVK